MSRIQGRIELPSVVVSSVRPVGHDEPLVLDWVAGPSVRSLFAQLGLRDGFRDRAVATLVDAVDWSHVLARVEELSGHHHLLLVRIRRLSLVH